MRNISPKRHALLAALRFTLKSPKWASDKSWTRDCVRISFDQEKPDCRFTHYSRNPEIHLYLRADWMTAVHGRGLDNLPTFPGIHPIDSERVLILHADAARFSTGDVLVAPVVYTRGRNPARGVLAWRRVEHKWSTVAAWGLGRTEADALEAISKWPANMLVSGDDAEALGGLVL